MATRVTVTKKGDTFTVRSPGLDPHDREYIFRTTKAAAARKAAEDRVAVLSEAIFDVECDWESHIFSSSEQKKAACKFQDAARMLGKKTGYRGIVEDPKAPCEIGTEVEFNDTHIAEVFKEAPRTRAGKKTASPAKAKKPWWQFW